MGRRNNRAEDLVVARWAGVRVLLSAEELVYLLAERRSDLLSVVALDRPGEVVLRQRDLWLSLAGGVDRVGSSVLFLELGRLESPIETHDRRVDLDDGCDLFWTETIDRKQHLAEDVLDCQGGVLRVEGLEGVDGREVRLGRVVGSKLLLKGCVRRSGDVLVGNDVETLVLGIVGNRSAWVSQELAG